MGASAAVLGRICLPMVMVCIGNPPFSFVSLLIIVPQTTDFVKPFHYFNGIQDFLDFITHMCYTDGVLAQKHQYS
jgi:hypothetical protein